jgi:hypothetical protein
MADLSAVGAAATARKSESRRPKELVSFSVRKGDNGGVTVSESYEAKAPEGRRRGAAFPDSFESKDNPFGPDDGDKARTHVTQLLGQMTGGGAAPRPAVPAPRPQAPPPVAPPAPPRAAAVVRPPGGPTIGAVTGRRPMPPMGPRGPF